MKNIYDRLKKQTEGFSATKNWQIERLFRLKSKPAQFKAKIWIERKSINMAWKFANFVWWHMWNRYLFHGAFLCLWKCHCITIGQTRLLSNKPVTFPLLLYAIKSKQRSVSTEHGDLSVLINFRANRLR